MPYNPEEKRVPKGSKGGGQWTSGGAVAAATSNPPNLRKLAAAKHREEAIRKAAPHLLEALKSGGFSEKISGRTPKGGFMTALSQKTEFRAPVSSFTEETIRQYALAHARELRTKNAYLGGWVDVDSGDGFLDVSYNFSDREECIRKARAAQQLAIFDLSTFDSIYVNDPSGKPYVLVDGKKKFVT